MTDSMPTLPKGWVWATLGDVVVRISNGIAQKQNKEKKGLPVTRIETISEGNINLEKVGFLDSVPYEMIEKFRLHPGDVLFSNINSDPHLGKTAVFRTDGFLLLHGMNLLLVRAEPRIILPDFLDYIFHYFRAAGVFSKIARHAVNQSSINQTALKGLLVPIPPLAEQQKIVHKMEALLQEVTTAKQSLQKVPALVKQFRQSVLANAFRGELTERDPNDEPSVKLLERIRRERRPKWEEDLRKKGRNPANHNFQDARPMSSESLPVLPSGWAWSRVDWVADVRLGRQRSPKNRSNKYPRKYLRAANIIDCALDLSDVKDMDFKPGEFDVYRLRRGDVLLSEGSGSPYEVGKCAVWDERIPDCCIQNTVIRVRSEDIPPQYLLYVFMYARYKGDFAKMVKGIEIVHLGAERLAAYRIPLAPKNEQLRICERIDSLLAMTKTAEKSTETALRNTAELERSLLSRAFRGELVLQDSNDGPASVLLERIRAQRDMIAKKARGLKLEEFASPATITAKA